MRTKYLFLFVRRISRYFELLFNVGLGNVVPGDLLLLELFLAQGAHPLAVRLIPPHHQLHDVWQNDFFVFTILYIDFLSGSLYVKKNVKCIYINFFDKSTSLTTSNSFAYTLEECTHLSTTVVIFHSLLDSMSLYVFFVF